jgi:lipopolysaccharide export system permease protein
MLGAGMSVGRIVAPLILVGALLTGGGIWLNLEHAPRAEANRETDLELITKPKKVKEKQLVGVTYPDPLSKRIWYIRRLDPKKKTLRDVQVTQMGPDGAITEKWYARAAEFRVKLKEWHFAQGKRVTFSPSGEILAVDDWSKEGAPKNIRKLNGWTETPERIMTSLVDPEVISVPELRDFLKYHVDVPEKILAPYETYMQYRFAFPFACLVSALIAGPLAIVHNRRGVLSSVASACGVFFFMLLLVFFFLALGKGGYVPPFVAAWFPPLLMTGLGGYLLWLRSTHRDLPSLRWPTRA